MESLSARDLRSALSTVEELSRIESLEQLRARAPLLIRDLVPCDVACFEEADLVGRTATWGLDPPEVRFAVRPEDFFAYAHQHPLLLYHLHSGDRSTHSVSDFVSLREWRERELYECYFGKLDGDRQIAHMAISQRGAYVVATALRKGERDFSARDRQLLELLRPHFARAHDIAVERGRAATALAAVEDAEIGVVLLDEDGRVDLATAPARRWLIATVGDVTRDGRLAHPLDDWVRTRRAAGDDERLATPPPVLDESGARVSFLPASPTRAGDALLIEPAATGISTVALREHGLTRREVDVLRGIARGGSNAQVAAELMLSVGTVRKHLDRIYEKLGVHRRGEAVAKARELSS